MNDRMMFKWALAYLFTTVVMFAFGQSALGFAFAAVTVACTIIGITKRESQRAEGDV